MMTYRHHSNPICADCGERHYSGSIQQCVEWLIEQRDDARVEIEQQQNLLHQQEQRIAELTQHDASWYDMSEADAFRLWAEDRKKLAAMQKVAHQLLSCEIYDGDNNNITAEILAALDAVEEV